MSEARSIRRGEAGARTLLKLGAFAAVLGIALAVADEGALGRWLVLAGIVAMIVGLHRFGRLGADAVLDLDGETSESERE